MFTSLRSRLWLSYAFVILVALAIVALVLFAFILRNPGLYRQTQQKLQTVEKLIGVNPEEFVAETNNIQKLAVAYGVRFVLYSPTREVLVDTGVGALPYPRKNPFNRNTQAERDSKGNFWLYTITTLSDGRLLVIAAPRPRVPVLSIFTDEFLLPTLEGGLIALFLSLILAFVLSRWVADPLQ